MSDKQLESVPGIQLYEDYKDFIEMRHLYESAIKELQVKLDILNDEFKIHHERNPIHHVESRLKSIKSIVTKLLRRGCEVSLESAKKHLNDIAGIRVVCGYIDDVYSVAEMLLRQSDVRLLKRQDYIENPNYNGYRSLHLDVELPIFLSDHTEYVQVEIQLRTVAMDFWASLEHDLRYKNGKKIPQSICSEMLQTANQISEIDKKMQEIYKLIQQI